MNEFGNLIISLRKKHNMTQKQLADKLNVSDKAVSRWETGKNYPDIEILQKLAEVFDTTIDDLLKGNDIEKNEKEQDEKRRRFKKTFLIIIALLIFLHIFPVYHLLFVAHNNYYGAQEICLLLYRGRISHRIEASETIEHCKNWIARGEDVKVKVWSVHLETYTAPYEGYIWMAYTDDGWNYYPVLVGLDKENEVEDGEWRVVDMREAP